MSILRPITRPILRPILRSPLEPGYGSRWAPSRLFAASEKGIAYDLTDASTLYQDSARTTLVSANGDPIGSVTDLSGNGKHASQATTASKPLYQGYADFDGVDDWCATAAIDFTGTGVVTLVAGLRKLSDAAAGMIAETSVSALSNNGSFWLAAGDGGANYSLSVRGTTHNYRKYATYTAPITNVISSTLKTTAASSSETPTTRINGAGVPGTSAGTGGSVGNFGNYPLYIGRRGGSSLPFTGYIYRMIVIGRTLTADELANAEAWCAEPAGVVLA